MKLVLICMSFVLALVTAQHSRCYQTPTYGDCTGYHKIWAYSEFRNKCLQYDYSGCGGNDNRFDTYTECMNTCHPFVPKTTTWMPEYIVH